DVPHLTGTRQSPHVIRQLIASIARSVGTEVGLNTLRRDLQAQSPTISTPTVAGLVDALERLFIVELVPAWSPRLRSKARLRTSPTYHLADAGLVIAALGATRKHLESDFETLGFIFESAVIHDLTIFVELMGGSIYHYRDSNDHEIDVILTLPDARWAAIEIKLGGGR